MRLNSASGPQGAYSKPTCSAPQEPIVTESALQRAPRVVLHRYALLPDSRVHGAFLRRSEDAVRGRLELKIVYKLELKLKFSFMFLNKPSVTIKIFVD